MQIKAFLDLRNSMEISICQGVEQGELSPPVNMSTTKFSKSQISLI